MPPEGLTPLSISEFAAKYGPIMEIVGMSRQGVKDILAMAYGVFPSPGNGYNVNSTGIVASAFQESSLPLLHRRRQVSATTIFNTIVGASGRQGQWGFTMQQHGRRIMAAISNRDGWFKVMDDGPGFKYYHAVSGVKWADTPIRYNSGVRSSRNEPVFLDGIREMIEELRHIVALRPTVTETGRKARLFSDSSHGSLLDMRVLNNPNIWQETQSKGEADRRE